MKFMKNYQTPMILLTLYEEEVYMDIFQASNDIDFEDNGDWE